jgi:hypothetical protein
MKCCERVGFNSFPHDPSRQIVPSPVKLHHTIGAIRPVIKAELVELQFAKWRLWIVSFPEKFSHDTHLAFGFAQSEVSEITEETENPFPIES